MRINITLPYQFNLTTKIVSLNMDIEAQNLTYREILEILGNSFVPQLHNMILDSDNGIMVVIIVDHKRVDPDNPVREGDQIILMMPLEGG